MPRYFVRDSQKVTLLNPMLAAELGHGQPALRLTQQPVIWALGETALLHRYVLVVLAEEIRRSYPLDHRQDYRDILDPIHRMSGLIT